MYSFAHRKYFVLFLYMRRLSPLQTCSLKGFPPGSLQHDVASIMLKTTNEERGTVAGLATLSQDLDDLDANGMFITKIALR